MIPALLKAVAKSERLPEGGTEVDTDMGRATAAVYICDDWCGLVASMFERVRGSVASNTRTICKFARQDVEDVGGGGGGCRQRSDAAGGVPSVGGSWRPQARLN